MAPRWLPLLLLVVAPAASDAKTVHASLIEGYQTEWKYVAKFAFTKTTRNNPGVIIMRAWSFLPGQRMLVYKNDDWFRAYRPAAAPGDRPTCEARAALSERNKTIDKGRFYGEAGQVFTEWVLSPTPEFWFLALARCDSWVRGVYDGDACIGERPNGNMPNGVFMYYELKMLNPGGHASAPAPYGPPTLRKKRPRHLSF